jgi:hypothetical protein
MRKQSLAGVVIGLLLLTGRAGPGQQQAKAPVASPRLAAAMLERAPGDLGKADSTGSLVLVTADKGKEILLFDSGSGELTSYLETGQSWGKPVRLRGRDGESFSPHAFRMAANGELVAFANPLGVNLFRRETGELVAEAPYLHHAAAIAAMPDGSWAVSLTRLPFPEIARADKEKFGGPAPRFVVVNDKLEIWRQGLPAQSDRTPNQAAARSLRLAAGPGRLFAAEVANYKIYEFNRELKLRSSYADPALKLEDGLGLSPNRQEQEGLLAEARQKMASAGTNALRPAPAQGGLTQGGAGKGRAEFFNYQTVISDMVWDPFTHQLILLLADGIAGNDGALDLLDPTTGHARRLLLRLPDGAAHKQLSQLAVGHRYLWLRSHAGATPTFRLDLSALEQARTVAGPTMEHLPTTGG